MKNCSKYSSPSQNERIFLKWAPLIICKYSSAHNLVPFANYRWRTCVGAAKGSLANAIGALYVRKFFNEEAKQSAVEMVHDIRAEFDFHIEEKNAKDVVQTHFDKLAILQNQV